MVKRRLRLYTWCEAVWSRTAMTDNLCGEKKGPESPLRSCLPQWHLGEGVKLDENAAAARTLVHS